jgi:hypothetical protein
VNIGVDKPLRGLLDTYDAVLYSGGSESPRPAGIPGADLEGVFDAMPYLVQQNRRVGRENIESVAWASAPILAGGKHVVVVGGGDTASDCVGTAFRQGAVNVTQLDIRPQPPEKEDKLSVWPYWATKMRTSSSQAEGAAREFQVATLEFIGEEGRLTHVKCCQVDEKRKPIAGSSSRLILHSSPSALPVRVKTAWSRNWATNSTSQLIVAAPSRSRPMSRTIAPMSTSSMPQAMCAVVSRWSSGQSAKAVRPRMPSMLI